MKILNAVVWILNAIAGILLLLSYLAPFVSPMIFWGAAFIGLAFPILILVNIVFIIYWAIQAKTKLIFGLVCVVLGYNHWGKVYQVSGEEKAKADDMFRIASMNVKGFDRVNGENTLDSILSYTAKQDLDVLCFQEFWNSNTKDGSTCIRKFKNQLGLKHFHFNAVVGNREGHGTLLMSRYPIINSGDIEFGGNSLNGGLWADLHINKDTIRVYCVHLQSNSLSKTEEFHTKDLENQKEAVRKSKSIIKRLKYGFERRSEQVGLLVDHMDASPFPIVIAGDMNDTQLSYTYRSLRGDRKDAFIESGSGMGNTYVGPFPSYRIDYIFFDDKFSGYSYETGPNLGSDHKLIQTLIEY